MSRKDKIKLFDKSDIYFCCEASNTQHSETIKDHTLMYVYTGELTILNKENRYKIQAHECVFLKKGSFVQITASSQDNQDFNAIYIRLTKYFLKDFFYSLNNKNNMSDNLVLTDDILKINCTPDIKSLFYSIIPYYKKQILPSPIITRLKLKAGIFSLLNMQIGFYSILFNFKEKWNFHWFELF